jgi:hypothetical protein
MNVLQIDIPIAGSYFVLVAPISLFKLKISDE